MQELKRLRRIVSVRTTQRDLSALRLLQARDHVEAQHRLLRQSERLTDQAAQRVARRQENIEQKAADEQAGRLPRELP